MHGVGDHVPSQKNSSDCQDVFFTWQPSVGVAWICPFWKNHKKTKNWYFSLGPCVKSIWYIFDPISKEKNRVKIVWKKVAYFFPSSLTFFFQMWCVWHTMCTHQNYYFSILGIRYWCFTHNAWLAIFFGWLADFALEKTLVAITNLQVKVYTCWAFAFSS